MIILIILLKWDLLLKCGILTVSANKQFYLLIPYLVYPDGKVCISILHPPGTDEMNSLETADERWRPIIGVESILLSVVSMLNDPNIDSPANIDAAVEYRDNKKEFEKKVKRLTVQSVESLWREPV